MFASVEKPTRSSLLYSVILSLLGVLRRRKPQKVVIEAPSLEAVGREMRAMFENEIRAVIPQILNTPVKLSSEIETFLDTQDSKEKLRIVLVITSPSLQSLKRVLDMAKEFTKDYFAQPENAHYRVRVHPILAPTTNQGEI